MPLASGESGRFLCEFNYGLGVDPSAFAISAARADMPKPSIPKVTPLSPTQRDQPKVAAASMDMRAVTSGGSTSSRYDCDCLAKSVQHGMDTTRVSMPRASSSFCFERERDFGPRRDQDEIG